MKDKQTPERTRGRILARTLAEELKTVRGAGGASFNLNVNFAANGDDDKCSVGGCTAVVTGHPPDDITNDTGDNDGRL